MYLPRDSFRLLSSRSTSAAWDNFMTAGFNVFQAARNCGIRRVAWASSIEV